MERMSRPRLEDLAAAAGTLGGMAALGVWAGLRLLIDEPAPEEAVRVITEREPAALSPGDRFSLVCWNLQFAGSRRHHFFYDGGEVVRVPRSEVLRTTAAIGRALTELDPDVVLLQEVDRCADRTGRVDQLQAYLQAGNWACWASAPYHRCRYLPYPAGEHLGRVDMHLALLSRFALEDARRLQLPKLREPWLRRALNLKRALLHARIPVRGGGAIRLGNTHLSAFSRGDGTLARQVAVLDRWMDGGEPYLLGGDFNLLPPGDVPDRLGDDRDLYADRSNPIEALIPKRPEVFGPDLLAERARSYLPFGAAAPDRKIDYAFAGGLEVIEARVIRDYDLSDHLPLWVRLRVPG